MKKYLIGTIVLLSFSFLINAESSNASCLSLQSNLGYGTRSSSVISLQNYLLENGYFNDEVTGYFGSITTAAVKAYQSAHGIDSTGFVGSLTRASLEAETCSGDNTSYTGTQTQVASNTQCPPGYTCTPKTTNTASVCPAGYTCTPKTGATNYSGNTMTGTSAYVPGSYYNSLTSQYTNNTQTNTSSNLATSNANSAVNSSTVSDSLSSAGDVSTNQASTIGAVTSLTTSATDSSCPALTVCVY